MSDKTLSPEQVLAIRERADNATQPPWRTNIRQNVGDDWLIGSVIDCGAGVRPGEDRYSDFIVTTDRVHASEMVSGGAFDDTDFIAHARTDVPALCDTVEALRAENERLRAMAARLFEEHMPMIERARAKKAEAETARLRGLLEDARAWFQQAAAGPDGADYLNGDDGRKDDRDGWDDADAIVARIDAALGRQEDAT